MSAADHAPEQAKERFRNVLVHAFRGLKHEVVIDLENPSWARGLASSPFELHVAQHSVSADHGSSADVRAQKGADVDLSLAIDDENFDAPCALANFLSRPTHVPFNLFGFDERDDPALHAFKFPGSGVGFLIGFSVRISNAVTEDRAVDLEIAAKWALAVVIRSQCRSLLRRVEN